MINKNASVTNIYLLQSHCLDDSFKIKMGLLNLILWVAISYHSAQSQEEWRVYPDRIISPINVMIAKIHNFLLCEVSLWSFQEECSS